MAIVPCRPNSLERKKNEESEESNVASLEGRGRSGLGGVRAARSLAFAGCRSHNENPGHRDQWNFRERRNHPDECNLALAVEPSGVRCAGFRGICRQMLHMCSGMHLSMLCFSLLFSRLFWRAGCHVITEAKRFTH